MGLCGGGRTQGESESSCLRPAQVARFHLHRGNVSISDKLSPTMPPVWFRRCGPVDLGRSRFMVIVSSCLGRTRQPDLISVAACLCELTV